MKKVVVVEKKQNFFVAYLPFSKANLEKMKLKKINKAVKKAEVELCSRGAEKILLADEIRKPLNIPQFEIGKEFYKLAPIAVLTVVNHFALKSPYPLAIRQRSPGLSAYYVAEKLIYECEEIRILTDNRLKGDELCDLIMDEFGAGAYSLPYDYKLRSGITIDLDERGICLFGSMTLKDFEADNEKYDCDINSVELFLSQKGSFDGIKLKSCMCGKNILTLKAF